MFTKLCKNIFILSSIFTIFTTYTHAAVKYVPIIMDAIVILVPFKPNVKPPSLKNGLIKKTGQTRSYATYDDGYYQKGVTPSYSRANKVVTDHIKGLQWQDDVNAKIVEKNWVGAKIYCSELNLNGGGWRLPTHKELAGLIDYGRKYPAISPIFLNTESYYYWSSTTHAGFSNDAWDIYFGNGHTYYGSKESNSYVRCVRSK